MTGVTKRQPYSKLLHEVHKNIARLFTHVNDRVQTYRCCPAVVNNTSDKPAVGSLTFWLVSLVPL